VQRQEGATWVWVALLGYDSLVSITFRLAHQTNDLESQFFMRAVWHAPAL